MVERVSNVALQWRLMNFFREFSQTKKHIPLSLSLNESIFWCLANLLLPIRTNVNSRQAANELVPKPVPL